MFGIARSSAKVGRVHTTLNRAINTIIMGPPGGGKGTISKKLIKDYDYAHISTGDILRANVREQTPLGKEAATFMNSGGLVPDALVIKMVVSEIAKLGDKNILFDGFPRTMAQATELEKQVKIDLALNLDVPSEEIVGRISGRWTHPGSGRVYAYDYNPPKVEGKDDVTGEPLIQRDDDKPEAVRKRLEAYDSMTAPLIKYYEGKGIIASSSGAQSPDLVKAGRRSDAIYAELKPVLNKKHNK